MVSERIAALYNGEGVADERMLACEGANFERGKMVREMAGIMRITARDLVKSFSLPSDVSETCGSLP